MQFVPLSPASISQNGRWAGGCRCTLFITMVPFHSATSPSISSESLPSLQILFLAVQVTSEPQLIKLCQLYLMHPGAISNVFYPGIADFPSVIAHRYSG